MSKKVAGTCYVKIDGTQLTLNGGIRNGAAPVTKRRRLSVGEEDDDLLGVLARTAKVVACPIRGIVSLQHALCLLQTVIGARSTSGLKSVYITLECSCI